MPCPQLLIASSSSSLQLPITHLPSTPTFPPVSPPHPYIKEPATQPSGGVCKITILLPIYQPQDLSRHALPQRETAAVDI